MLGVFIDHCFYSISFITGHKKALKSKGSGIFTNKGLSFLNMGENLIKQLGFHSHIAFSKYKNVFLLKPNHFAKKNRCTSKSSVLLCILLFFTKLVLQTNYR